MRFIVIGSVNSTRICLRKLAVARDVQVPAIVTLPPDLAKRHSDYVNLSADAADCGARLIFAPDSNAADVVQGIAALEPDCLAVVGWSQIIGERLRETAKSGAIGYHPTALPRLRGRAVIPWTILLDEKITGSTLFWLDDNIDSGPILSQRFFHVAPDETASSLYARHMDILSEMLDNVIPQIVTGKAPRQPQDERYATFCAKRIPADGMIDWHLPAETLWRLIRAVTKPYAGAFTFDPTGRRLTIWSATLRAKDLRQVALPGQIVARFRDSFTVRCGDGVDLHITEFSDGCGEMSPVPRLHVRLGLFAPSAYHDIA